MPISPTTVKSQAIVKIAANQYILMHPETDADIVKLAVEGITATNVQDAIAELHAYIQQITGGGVVTGVKGEAEESYRVGQVNITKANVGLGNVQNLAPADMPISTATQQALDSKADSASLANYIPVSQKGTSDGVASLDSSGKVPSAQLPSYVDDVIEGTYVNTTTFNDSDGSPVTPESGKIYVDTATNQEYRWGGTQFVLISESLALGETESTAYAGNKGKQNADNIAAIIGGTTKVGNAANADNATNAGNVTGSINGQAISTIFEDDGVTAKQATKLATARDISLSGDATGSASFDGSAVANITVTLSATGITPGTYSSVTFDAKGRATAGGQMVEVGEEGQDEPSATLAIGGTFYKRISDAA